LLLQNIISFVMPPALTIEQVGSSVRLSWLTAATDYQLQWTSLLESGVWQPVTNQFQKVGTTNVVLEAISDAQRYYRLTK
jgi:hypothetical protein